MTFSYLKLILFYYSFKDPGKISPGLVGLFKAFSVDEGEVKKPDIVEEGKPEEQISRKKHLCMKIIHEEKD